MAEYDYDLFVIGAGSGGVRAARMSAGFGARVAVAEERFFGGTCVNVGCVPKKLFVYASEFSHTFADARGYGWDSTLPNFDWPTLRENKNREITRLNGAYRGMLEKAGVIIFEARARVLDAHTVAVGEQHITCAHILVATGSRAFVPDIPGREYLSTSFEMFYLDQLPRRALVIGGGYIAVEFAGILHGLGVATTLAYRGERILRGFDDDLRAHVDNAMRRQGIEFAMRTDVVAIQKKNEATLITQWHTHNPGGEAGATTTEREFDLILCATGRVPNSADLGLEAAGVKLGGHGQILVNDLYQTSVPSIHALGDVIDRVMLTPVALAEGMALAKNRFGPRAENPVLVDYNNIPTAVFCQPNLGTVGLTEAQALEQGAEVVVYQSIFRPMKYTLAGRDEKTLMKLVVDGRTQRVLGAHMAGPDAGEIIQGLAIAIKAGATKAMFDATLGIHPTAAEEFVTMRTPR